MNKTLIVLILLSLTSITHAANWVTIGKNSTHTYYIDTSSLTQENGIATAWFKFITQGDPANNTGPRDYTTLSYVSHMYFNCLKKTGGTETLIVYKGNHVEHSETEPTVQYAPIAPDSINENLLRAACRTPS